MIFTYKFCHFVISNTSSVWLHRIIIKGFVLCLVTQSCLTVTPRTVACQAPLSMGILQARVLEWVAMPFCMGSS